ncbi:uncharacterized protein [Diadema setosum]|uniref:uncharacterized protein n=1 Tax=Diadema setosum TaxID=31175 RepID=UPI003B3A5CA6
MTYDEVNYGESPASSRSESRSQCSTGVGCGSAAIALHLQSTSSVEYRLASTVGTVPTAIGWKDEDTRLLCTFEGTPLAVYWVKEDMTSPGQRLTLATFFEQKFTSKIERFHMEVDFSLIISNLEVADEGYYRCKVVLLDFSDFSNSTFLTVNAMAKEHIIEQCAEEVHDLSPCTIQTSKEAPTFHLDCRLTGFKPNVSLLWSKSGRALSPVRSSQHTSPDGTFERFETITVTASHDKEQNFTCTAIGDSVNGTSSKVITALPLTENKNNPSGLDRMGLRLGLTLLILVLVMIVLFLVTGKLLQKYKPELMPEGLTWIPCWKRPLIARRERFREKLREKIRNYKPGSARQFNLGNLKLVNINLFGQTSAGKSAFINSLFFALKGGIFDKVADEKTVETTKGVQTRLRNHHPLTDYITVQDNRGMNHFNLHELNRIKDEINGCRSMDTEHKIVKDKSEECHAAILIYHKMELCEREANEFINQFFKEVEKIHASSPLLVITHRDEYQNPEAVVLSVKHFVGDAKKIFLVENYREESHEEDVEKDIQLLQFLWTTLKTCDQNAYNLAIKNNEVIEEPKPKYLLSFLRPIDESRPIDDRWCSVM